MRNIHNILHTIKFTAYWILPLSFIFLVLSIGLIGHAIILDKKEFLHIKSEIVFTAKYIFKDYKDDLV